MSDEPQTRPVCDVALNDFFISGFSEKRDNLAAAPSHFVLDNRNGISALAGWSFEELDLVQLQISFRGRVGVGSAELAQLAQKLFEPSLLSEQKQSRLPSSFVRRSRPVSS